MKNGLLKKFFTYLYGSGIGLIIGVITTMISTRILSPEDFGKASMFSLAVNILMIFIIFGTDQTFVRFFYEENKNLRGKLLFNSMKFPLFLLSAVLLILFIKKESILLFLFGEVNSAVFLVFITSIVFQMIYRFSLLVIRMQQKGHLYSIMEILNKSFNLGLLIFLYYLLGPRYEILIFSTAMTLVILTIISIYIEKEFWNSFGMKVRNTKHTQLDIIKFSYPLVLTTLITWLFQSFDKIAIRHWSNFEELGLYSAAFRIVALLSIVQTTFSTFWAPVCYEHFEKHPQDKEFFSKTSKILGLFMFTIAILTILFKDLIVMLLGSDYSGATQIMPFLIFMPIMYTLSETTMLGINFYKKPKWHILIAILACLTNIVGNFILVPIYGAAGAAISTGLSYVLFFALRTHISLRYFPVDYGLTRVYFFIIAISIYALQNTLYFNILWSYLIGTFLLVAVAIFYKKEINIIINIVKNRKTEF